MPRNTYKQRLLFTKDPTMAYFYARDTIKSRWPEAEEFIKKEPQIAYWYARYVIEGRWPEAEEYIKKDSYCAYYYAITVIKRRWPEAEESIKRHDHIWQQYKNLICQECSGLGIIDLGIGGAEEECSQCHGGGLDLKKQR